MIFLHFETIKICSKHWWDQLYNYFHPHFDELLKIGFKSLIFFFLIVRGITSLSIFLDQDWRKYCYCVSWFAVTVNGRFNGTELLLLGPPVFFLLWQIKMSVMLCATELHCCPKLFTHQWVTLLNWVTHYFFMMNMRMLVCLESIQNIHTILLQSSL